jgi:hypothetical protein
MEAYLKELAIERIRLRFGVLQSSGAFGGSAGWAFGVGRQKADWEPIDVPSELHAPAVVSAERSPANRRKLLKLNLTVKSRPTNLV